MHVKEEHSYWPSLCIVCKLDTDWHFHPFSCSIHSILEYISANRKSDFKVEWKENKKSDFKDEIFIFILFILNSIYIKIYCFVAIEFCYVYVNTFFR